MVSAHFLPPWWGKVRMGGEQMSHKDFFYFFNPIHYLMVPKPYYLKLDGLVKSRLHYSSVIPAQAGIQ